MSTIEQKMLDTLKEIHKWIKFSGWTNVKGILLDTLDEPEKLVAYSLTTGENGLDFIAGKIGKSRKVIQNYWASWQKIGIVESISVRGGSRARALFDLGELGIEIPEIIIEEEQDTTEVEKKNE